jgi:hypothetical protein
MEIGGPVERKTSHNHGLRGGPPGGGPSRRAEPANRRGGQATSKARACFLST